jgi:hypothetical protein
VHVASTISAASYLPIAKQRPAHSVPVFSFPDGVYYFAMSTDSKLQRVRFANIDIDQTFYDPISAEYFVKRSEMHAAMISGSADGSVLDEFEEDDLVGIGQG